MSLRATCKVLWTDSYDHKSVRFKYLDNSYS